MRSAPLSRRRGRARPSCLPTPTPPKPSAARCVAACAPPDYKQVRPGLRNDPAEPASHAPAPRRRSRSRMPAGPGRAYSTGHEGGQDAGGQAESVAAGNWRAGGMTGLDRQLGRSLAPVLRYPLQFCSGPPNFWIRSPDQFPASLESEVRLRDCCETGRTSDSGH